MFGGEWNPMLPFGHVKLDKPIRQSTGDVKIAVGDNIKFTGREWDLVDRKYREKERRGERPRFSWWEHQIFKAEERKITSKVRKE